MTNLLRLWHGTTAEAAAAIATRGFTPCDVASRVNQVAGRYGVEPDTLRRWLAANWRYASLQRARDGRVWFAGSYDTATSWAQRAPEVEWEARLGVWHLTNGEASDRQRPNQELAWHVRQQLPVSPAVVEVVVAPTLLVLPESRGPTRIDPMRYALRIREGRVTEVELSVLLGPESVVAVSPVERWVTPAEFAALTAQPTSEIERRVASGELPPLRRFGPTKLYWHLSEIEDQLAPPVGD